MGKYRWYLAAFVANATMATLGVFVRNISSGNDYAIPLGRFGIGLVCLLIWRALWPGGRKEPVRVSWPLVASGVAMPFMLVFYIAAINTITLATAGFLLYLGPVIASFLAAIFLEKGFDPRSALLLGCALLGTLFITEFKLPDDPDQLEGLGAGLLCGLFYGLFLFFNHQKFQRGMDDLSRSSYQFLFATLIMIPVAAIGGTSLEASDLPWLGAIGVLHGFVAMTLLIVALGYLKTIEYSTISYSEPTIAALIGWQGYHEGFSTWQMVGAGLVILAGLARVIMQSTDSTELPG